MLATVFLTPALVGGEGMAASPDTAASNGSVVGEIVVTAEKRSSTVQKTAISITAITGRDLQAKGITSAQGIVQSVPGIAVASAGPGQAVYEIRGLSADGGESPTIGFYLDEIPVTPPAEATTGKSAIDPDLYDLARVEVLRGPQGTLYGAGSMGGTVKLVSNLPDLSGVYGSAESILSGTDGGGLNYAEKAMFNAPLVEDKVALRVVASYGHTSGWIDRVVVPNFPLESDPSPDVYGTTRGNVSGVPGSQIFKNVNDENSTSLRASLLIKPTDQLTITPSIFFQNISQGGMNAYDSTPGGSAHYEPYNIAEPSSDRFTVYALTASYDFGPVTLTSATGYWDRRSAQIQDATELTQNVFQLPAYSTAGGLGVGSSTAFETDTSRQFSQEVRLSSNGDGPLKWLVGGYYSQYDYVFETGETVPGFLNLAGSPYQTDLVFLLNLPHSIDQVAGFANASYKIGGKLTVTAGARYFSYRSRLSGFNAGLLYGADPQYPVSASASASGVTPMVNVSYAANQNLMIYASASKGFREGAGNVPIPTTGTVGSACLLALQAIGLNSAPLTFKPDTVWTYEAGEKGRFLAGKVTINSDLYYTQWSGVQQPVAVCGLGFTTNGANATVMGGETEIRAKLTDNLSLIQSLGYADAAFSNSFLAAGVVKGQAVLDVPRWTVSTTLQYRRPLADGYNLLAGISNSIVSSSQDLTYTLNTVPERDITNVRIGLEADKWSAFLFVDNVLNQRRPIEYLNLLSFTGPPYNRIATNQPLTAGIDLSAKF